MLGPALTDGLDDKPCERLAHLPQDADHVHDPTAMSTSSMGSGPCAISALVGWPAVVIRKPLSVDPSKVMLSFQTTEAFTFDSPLFWLSLV